MKKKTSRCSSAAVAVAGIVLMGSFNFAAANLVIDGGFELPSITGTFTTYNPGAMGGWTVVSGSVDLIHNYWQPAEGTQSLDTAGNISGKIQQTIATTIGTTYRLTFDMSGNPDGNPTIKSLFVTFGSVSQTFNFDTTGITRANMGWTAMSWDVVATSSSSLLSFQDSGGTAYGSALDNVSLVAVPEPATVVAGALLLLPFGASLLRIVRKNRGA
jgi:choice-of-anchor C domain-containing protein